MFRSVAGMPHGYLCVLLYNFCFFAMQVIILKMNTEKLLESGKQFGHIQLMFRGDIPLLFLVGYACLRHPDEFPWNDFPINTVAYADSILA
jgi:hypothetical protein